MMEHEPPPPPKRRSIFSMILAVVVIGGAGIGVFVYQMTQGQRKSSLDASGFDIEKTSDQPRRAASSAPQAQAQSSLGMIKGADGIRLSAAAGAADKSKPPEPAPEQRKKELEFLQRYGGVLAQYHGRLARITDKFYKKDPVVRDVDRAFSNMPRYMAIKARYEKDGDPFQFARDVIALPEVRDEIAKRMTDVNVWKAAISMMTETLRTQPAPQPVYDAAKNFMLFDPSMSKYISDFATEAQKNIPAAVGALPSGSDLDALNKVLRDVAPQAAAGMSAPGH